MFRPTFATAFVSTTALVMNRQTVFTVHAHLPTFMASDARIVIIHLMGKSWSVKTTDIVMQIGLHVNVKRDLKVWNAVKTCVPIILV
jgi:hypothetical protein